jgi:hypothetical protein
MPNIGHAGPGLNLPGSLFKHKVHRVGSSDVLCALIAQLRRIDPGEEVFAGAKEDRRPEAPGRVQTTHAEYPRVFPPSTRSTGGKPTKQAILPCHSHRSVPHRLETPYRSRSMFSWCAHSSRFTPNVPDPRPRANDARNASEPQSRGSLHPFGAVFIS